MSDNHSFRVAAQLMGNQVSKSTLHRWSTIQGDLRRKPHPQSKTNDQVVAMVASFLTTNPHTTCKEVCLHLGSEHDIDISESSVRSCIRRAGYTRKACRWVVDSARVEGQRQKYADQLVNDGIRPSDVINFDESSFQVIQRPSHGYSLRGRRLNVPVRSYRSSAVSLLLAVTSDGQRRWRLERTSVTGFVVADYIRTSLRDTGKRFLLMDNASIHKTKDVMRACADVGLTPLFLSPYSPFFAPVESCFHVLKHTLRRQWRGDEAMLQRFDVRLGAAIESMSMSGLEHTFDKCWSRARGRSSICAEFSAT